MEDPRESTNESSQPPMKRKRVEEDQIQKDQASLRELYEKNGGGDSSNYNIVIDEGWIEKVDKENKLPTTALGFASMNPDGKYMLTGQIEKLKKVTVREFIAQKQKEFVDFLSKILPPDKRKWCDMIAKVPTDEWIATISRKIVPELSNAGGIDNLLLHILTFSDVTPQELGTNEQSQKQNFELIKRYLINFGNLVKKIHTSSPPATKD